MQRNNIEYRQRASTAAKAASVTTGIIDMAALTAIFATFTTETLHRFLESLGKYIFFPIAAGASVIQAALAWRQAALGGHKRGLVVKAVVETVAAAAIVVAVGGAVTLGALFTVAAPAIFAVTLGAKALFSAGSAAYYWGKSTMTEDAAKKGEYRSKALHSVAQTVALTLATTAVVSVMLLGQVALAGVGIAAGVFGALYLGAVGISMLMKKSHPKGYQAVATNDDVDELERGERPQVTRSLSTSALMGRSFGHRERRAAVVARQPSNDAGEKLGFTLLRHDSDGVQATTVNAAPEAPAALR